MFCTKNLLIFSIILVSCSHPEVYEPVGNSLKKSVDVSKNRAKEINILEREQIKEWIALQERKFYSVGKNYWINIPKFDQRNKKEDGSVISYEYEFFDFDGTKIYPDSKVIKKHVVLGKYNEVEVVEDAVRYMKSNEHAELLVPSVLAFGVCGDGNQIPGDTPVIIKIKMF